MRRPGGRPSRQALSSQEHSIGIAQDDDSEKINSALPDLNIQLNNVISNGLQAKTQPETEGRTDPKTQPKTEGRTDPRVEGELQPETEGRTIPKTHPETEGRTIPKTQPETEGRTIPKTQPETEGRTISKTQPETEGRTIPKTQPETEGGTIPKTQPETEGRTLPKTQPETEGRTIPRTKKFIGATKNNLITDSYEVDSNNISNIFFSFEFEKKSTKLRLLESLSRSTLNSEIIGLTERLHHGRLCLKLKITDSNLKKLLVRLSDEGLISIDKERSKLGRSGWVRYWVRREIVEYCIKINGKARNLADREAQSKDPIPD